MTNVQIRPALADDAAAMARVQITGWRTAYRGIFPDDVLDRADAEAATDKWRQRLAAPDAVAFVAVASSGIAAIAAGGPPAKEPRLDFGPELYSLYLLPEWRRRGIGRQLLATIFSAFLGNGAEAAYLWCLAGNQDGRSFYARLGGAEMGSAERPSVGGLVRRSVAIAWSRDVIAAIAREAAGAAPGTIT
jgi:GNAT superfamily N-acetyltransferase